jgi:glycosyltransferase involved in cell wall biosynthesis
VLDRVFRFWEGLFSILLDGYIVNSDSTKQTLRKLTKQNILLIYNGVEDTHQIYLKKNNNKNVITIANLSARKGYENYLKAIAIVVNKVPDSQFLFLGKDNLNGKIQKMIIENNLMNHVQYLGFQDKVDFFF